MNFTYRILKSIIEQQRQQWLEHSIINATPELQPRLKGLHWEINMDLEIARNKYKRCNLIADRLVEHLNAFKKILAGNTSIYINHQSAKILNFVQPRITD